MIDGHIHYIEYMGADRLNQIVEEYHYDGIALQCIPDSAGREVLGDAIRYREQCPVPVYIFGGIRREVYRLPEDELRTALVWEARNLMTKGCTGIKMLEGIIQFRILISRCGRITGHIWNRSRSRCICM